MKTYLLILISILLVTGCCNDDEDEKLDLVVSDIRLTDVGQIPYEFSFTATPDGNGSQDCKIRTLLIKKNDTIESISASVQSNNLNIYVKSSPFDFYCNDIECFTVHDVSFKMTGLQSGEYKVYVSINRNEDKEFYYTIK